MWKIFLVIATLIIGSFFVTTTAHAEMTTYEGVGEYSMMKGETQDFGKKRAKERAEESARRWRA